MTNYSQADPRWKSKKLGTSSVSIGGYGCAITAVANLAGVTPDEVNTKLIENGGYRDGELIVWSKAAELYGLPYVPGTAKAAFYPTIGETDHFKSKGTPQHFFVLLEDGTIIDSLDGKHKANPYKVVGYRNVGTKEDSMEREKEQRLIELESKVVDLRSQVDKYNKLSDEFETQARDLEVKLNQATAENEALRAEQAKVVTETPKVVTMTEGMKTTEFGLMAFIQLIGGYVFTSGESDWIKAIALIGMFVTAGIYIWSRTKVKECKASQTS